MLSRSDIKIIKDLLKGFATKRDLNYQIKPIKDSFKNFATKDDLKNFATKDDLKLQLKPLKEDVSKIRKDINVVIDFFDHEYLGLRKRVERIEDHLDLPPIL